MDDTSAMVYGREVSYTDVTKFIVNQWGAKGTGRNYGVARQPPLCTRNSG